MSALPSLGDLPPFDRLGITPDDLGRELIATVHQAMADDPRSQQELPGPSELGTPCTRKLAHRIARTPKVNTAQRSWKAYIGTSIHATLDEIFTQSNRGGPARWLCETRVPVGVVGDDEITGQCDLYDRATNTAIDWKTTSRTRINKYREEGPGKAYRDQIHLYGAGWANRGLPVEHVMIVFLPRDAELHQSHIWHEPYDPAVADAALRRAQSIATLIKLVGPGAFAITDTANDFCGTCPWFRNGATDLTTACPGDPAHVDRTAPVRAMFGPQEGTAA